MRSGFDLIGPDKGTSLALVSRSSVTPLFLRRRKEGRIESIPPRVHATNSPLALPSLPPSRFHLPNPLSRTSTARLPHSRPRTAKCPSTSFKAASIVTIVSAVPSRSR